MPAHMPAHTVGTRPRGCVQAEARQRHMPYSALPCMSILLLYTIIICATYRTRLSRVRIYYYYILLLYTIIIYYYYILLSNAPPAVLGSPVYVCTVIIYYYHMLLLYTIVIYYYYILLLYAPHAVLGSSVYVYTIIVYYFSICATCRIGSPVYVCTIIIYHYYILLLYAPHAVLGSILSSPMAGIDILDVLRRMPHARLNASLHACLYSYPCTLPALGPENLRTMRSWAKPDAWHHRQRVYTRVWKCRCSN